MDLKESVTIQNLMRAFAGESQAWSRYTFAAQWSENAKMNNIAGLFRFTAGQEKEHAQVFYGFLQGAGADNVEITAGYPVDLRTEPLALLRGAVKNERAESDTAYPAFARKAREEGFNDIAVRFDQIAAIERSHADRFCLFGDLLEQGKLFRDDGSTVWVCLNCGHILTGAEAPQICPVCSHPRGYFVRAGQTPYQ